MAGVVEERQSGRRARMLVLSARQGGCGRNEWNAAITGQSQQVRGVCEEEATTRLRTATKRQAREVCVCYGGI